MVTVMVYLLVWFIAKMAHTVYFYYCFWGLKVVWTGATGRLVKLFVLVHICIRPCSMMCVYMVTKVSFV